MTHQSSSGRPSIRYASQPSQRAACASGSSGPAASRSRPAGRAPRIPSPTPTEWQPGRAGATRNHRRDRKVALPRVTVWSGLVVKVLPAVLPVIRLDYALISRDPCTARTVRVFRVLGSDHSAVLVIIDVDLAS